MELLGGSNLTKYLLEKYSKNPRGWNFTIAPSPKDSFFDALVTGPEESWQLKIDSIFKPSPVVMGAKIEIEDSVKGRISGLESIPSYGYRRLEPDVILRLLSQSSEAESPYSVRASNLDEILRSVDPTIPVVGQPYAEGPFVFTNQKIARATGNQRKLDDRLASEIRSLLRNRYLGYG